jgi:hypothetical protein
MPSRRRIKNGWVCVQTCWCTYASPLSSLVFLLPSVYRCFSVLASHTTQRNVAAAVFPPLHFPTGSPSASSLRTFCTRAIGVLLVQSLVVGADSGFRDRGEVLLLQGRFVLRLPTHRFPSSHTTQRDVAAAVFPPFTFPYRQSECIILANLTRPFALVQSGCFSYSRWWWAQTAGFAIAGKCGLLRNLSQSCSPKSLGGLVSLQHPNKVLQGGSFHVSEF